jgi:hypothetical protein
MCPSFYNLLEELLEYRHKGRKSAGDLLGHEFCQLHKQTDDLSITDVVQDSMASNNNDNNNNNKMKNSSMRLMSSVQRHSMFLDFKKFERSVTTLVATLLSKQELNTLLKKLETKNELETKKLNIIPMKELQMMLQEMKQTKWYVI